MPSLPRSMIEYGSEQPLPERRVLRAGPLTAVLEGADLRYIRFGAQEVLRRVYVAVRDPNWGTVPAALSNMRIDSRDDGFDVAFDARHADGVIDFAWHATITGRPDGTISYVMDGQARSTFRKNRIGLCMLHPMDCAGMACRIRHSDGTVENSSFPRYIAPHQPFRDLALISHAAAPGVEIEVRLDGDVFETEDQRNWTDASFKTYSTPLELPFPVAVTAGAPIRQSLELRVRDGPSSPPAPAAERAASTSGDAVGSPKGEGTTALPSRPEGAPLSLTLLSASTRLPRLGVCLGAGELPTGWELDRLRELYPAHLRLDLDLADAGAGERLLQAAGLGLPLLVALFVDEEQHELARFCAAVAGRHLPIAAWLVFHKQHKVTGAQTIRLARAALNSIAPQVPLGAGTNAYFAELNRHRPSTEQLDLVAFSINPQVHAFDTASLVENLAAQAATVESARRFCGDRQLAIGPVSLKPRYNPDATGPQPVLAPATLPPTVDTRQLSLLGAGWTVGSLKYLAQAGAASITYYEATGWRGVMETNAGPAMPDRFPSRPRMLFPLYHVLADVGEFSSPPDSAPGAPVSVIGSLSSDPLAVDGLVLRDAGRLRILLANLDGKHHHVEVRELGGDNVTMRLLDHSSYDEATLDGAAFRGRGERRALERGTLRLQLPPFAVATIDGELG